MPGTNDLALNPEKLRNQAEKMLQNQRVNYFSNPSEQVPTINIEVFAEIMDNKANYPVLIHCYHGTGRAEILCFVPNRI
jgi:protein tyrosine/serine phosphatase